MLSNLFMIDGFRKAKPAVTFNPVYHESNERCLLSLLFVLMSQIIWPVLLFVFVLQVSCIFPTKLFKLVIFSLLVIEEGADLP